MVRKTPNTHAWHINIINRWDVQNPWFFSGAVCPIQGQVYQVCGSSCQRTCREISMDLPCQEECAEGCNCPKGKVLKEDNLCVPFSLCPCYHDGRAYDPGTSIKPTGCNEWWELSHTYVHTIDLNTVNTSFISQEWDQETDLYGFRLRARGRH